MQYTCCDWDIIDKTSYDQPWEICDAFCNTISMLKNFIRDFLFFGNHVIEDALINFFWGHYD